MYARGALSAEMIFAQAFLKEIGLSFLIHARADSRYSTRSSNETRSKSQDESHSHEILIHSIFGFFGNF